MSIRKDKRRSFINFILITFTIVFLNAIGVSYAYYAGGLQISTSITTGNLDVSFDDGSKKKDLGIITITKPKYNQTDNNEDNVTDSDMDVKTGSNEINSYGYEYAIINNSSLPIKAPVVNKTSLPIESPEVNNRFIPNKTAEIDSEETISALYENQRIKLDLSEYLEKSPGAYKFNVQIIFDQLNNRIK